MPATGEGNLIKVQEQAMAPARGAFEDVGDIAPDLSSQTEVSLTPARVGYEALRGPRQEIPKPARRQLVDAQQELVVQGNYTAMASNSARKAA